MATQLAGTFNYTFTTDAEYAAGLAALQSNLEMVITAQDAVARTITVTFDVTRD